LGAVWQTADVSTRRLRYSDEVRRHILCCHNVYSKSHVGITNDLVAVSRVISLLRARFSYARQLVSCAERVLGKILVDSYISICVW